MLFETWITGLVELACSDLSALVAAGYGISTVVTFGLLVLG